MKKYKPVTPGRRGMTQVTLKKVTASKPFKKLTKGKKRDVGRNGYGRITTRHKGGGHKRLYRDIDFLFNKKDIQAKIETIEYDPNRSGLIALVLYSDGERRYMLLPQSLKIGDKIVVSEKAPIRAGNRLRIKNISVGTFIYNIELKPEGGAKLARSAGNYAEVIGQDGGYSLIKMPSSEIRKVLGNCWASIGEVSNEENKLVNIGKAGRNRWLGKRPTVRGSAMNPVDHPHGGGEGRSGRGHKRARSKWGKPTGKGQKTRKSKKYSNILIAKRRKVGKRR
jgi:large subunit ribosomal protein L2